MGENRVLSGELLGKPFLVSVDRNGTRIDKENCGFLVQDYHVPMGYQAYLFDTTYPIEYVKNLASYCPNASILYGLPEFNEIQNNDIIEVGDDGKVYVIYRDNSTDNVLFITNQCNSNCIMCPDSDYNRKKKLPSRFTMLTRFISLLPSDTPHLTITGGEPTLLKWDLIELIRQCRDHLPCTEFLMLSNGRSLSVPEYRNEFLQVIPRRFRLAVPLYSAHADIHDEITRAPGGFAQTIEALYHLQHEIELEIRIVVMKLNYESFPEIANFIADRLPKVATVSFMGMELMGNAFVNRENLWVDYQVAAPYIEQAAHILLEAGIDAHIYNFPLCCLPRRLWPLTDKSITDYKVRFRPECEQCAVQNLCGGFFHSTIHYDKISVHPILEE